MKYLLFILGIIIPAVSFSQYPFDVYLSSVQSNYTSVLNLNTIQDQIYVSGNNGLLNLTGEDEVDYYPHYTSEIAPYINNWTSFSDAPYAWYANTVQQPNLYLALGGAEAGSSLIDIQAINGSNQLGGLYCGLVQSNGLKRRYVDIYNEDTLFIKNLLVPKEGILRHHGPAPVVITEQFINYGTVYSDADNILCQANKEEAKISTFDNRGTFIGRMKYETLVNYRREQIGIVDLFDWYQPLNLQDSVQIAIPYLNTESADYLQNLMDNNQLSEIAQFIDSLYQINYTYPWNYYIGQSYTGFPLKGTRFSREAGDFRVKHMWKDWREIKKPFIFTEDTYEGLTIDEVVGNGELAVWITATGYSNTNQQDTLIYIGDELTAIFETYEWVDDSLTFINDTVPVTDLEFLINITAYENPVLEGLNYSWITFDEDELSVSYGDKGTASSLVWSDWRVETPTKNRLYEKEGHYFLADSGYGSTEIFENFGVSGIPIVPTVGEDPNSLYLLQAGFPESYPYHGYDAPYLSSFSDDDYPYYNGTFVPGWDASTPVPFPLGVFMTLLGSQNTETVLQYRGTPWMNSDEAYIEYPYHPSLPGQNDLIPNLKPPSWLGQDNNFEAKIHLPPKTNVQYVYSPSGSLFESSSWANCYDASADNFNYDSLQIIAFCETELSAYSTLSPDNFYINAENNTVIDEEYLDFLLANTAVAALRENNFYHVSSPVLGYLDLDRVAERFFEENEDAQYLDFHWYNSQGFPVADPSQYLLAIDPFIGSKKFFRKKYYKLGDEVMTSELDFWLSLLYLEFQASNGAGFSDLALNIVSSLEDGEVTFADGPIINWLYNGQFNPAQYVELSQYVPPGVGLWIGNNIGQETTISIRPEDGIYDYNWSDSTNQIFAGTVGPVETLGRQGASNLPEFPNSNILENHNVILAYAWQNDSTYFPFPAIMHQFADNAKIGTHNPEDQGVQFPIVPYAYTDSSNFVASRYFKEDVPHNSSPTHMHIVAPPINGAWVFSPISFQSPDNIVSNSQAISNLSKPLRLGIQLYDETGEYNIQYLDYMDTMYVRFEDYNFPIEAKTYWTTLQCDFNGDGLVSINDLTDVLGAFGVCEPATNFNATFDANEDGCVGVADLILAMTELGHNIGVEVGEFEGISGLVSVGGRLTGTLRTEFESFIENELPSYLDAGFKYDPATLTLKYFGEEIIVYDSELKVIASGYNQVQLPNVDEFYLVAAESAVCKINTNATLVVPASDPGNYTYNAVVYTPEEGSSIVNFWDNSLKLASVAEWTELYTDFDQYSGNLNPLPNISPYINQLYYGWNSNKQTGDLYSPSNAITAGLVDVFSAGQPESDIFNFNKGVYADPKWKSASEGYEDEIGIGSTNIFTPKNILFGFASKRNKENLHSDQIHNSSETLKISNINGASTAFGPYSVVTTELDPSASVWGSEDIKEYYDAPFENAVLSMVDMMTLRDYFRFKLKGNSPKFGAKNPRDTGNWPAQSFGNPYNINTVIGEQQQIPEKQWAPNTCNTYQDWTDNIVTPFFAAFMGQPVSITIEGAPPIFTGEELNNDANHYQWFQNSTLFEALGTYGPLVYDFDWNGVWEQKDLDIWNSITSVWSQLGDDAGRSYYAPANYYRAGTDALNTIVNVLPEYSNKKDSYIPAKNFTQYFNISNGEATIDTRIANWANCLNGNEYIEGNQSVGPEVQASQFTYTTDLPLLEPATLSLAMSSSAPRNTANAIEITDYHSIPGGYLVVPSSTFFPVSLIRN